MLVLAAVATAFAVVGFLPLFGGPGYESALVMGLLAPAPLAVQCAWRVRRQLRAQGVKCEAWLPALGACLSRALLWVAVLVGVACLHGFRVGFCDVTRGLSLLLLGPGAGCLLAGCFGFVVGVTTARAPASLAVAVALVGPVGGVGVSVWRFISSPMVFAFDPFVGFFAGTIYDTVIDAIPRLLTYRAGSLGTVVAVLAGTSLMGLLRSATTEVSEARIGDRVPVVCCAVGLVWGVGVAFGVWLWGPALGHYQSVGSIADQLGRSIQSARCDVVFSSAVSETRARLLLSECEQHLDSHERYFRTRLAGRVTVFVFDSAAQKGALMGASRTYIAKPWRREVYIQTGSYPHPVLGHELAHVVAGAFATGPFDVAGPLGGWIPDPGRIEGFAVAAAPPEDIDYGLMDWARALRDLDALPSADSLFRLSFLGHNSSKAYTVAGAYIQFVHARYGPEVLKKWYAGAPLDQAVVGLSFSALQAQFVAALDEREPDLAAQRAATMRFERPAIFGRTCPHTVDERLQRATDAYRRGQWEQARRLYLQAGQLDPSSLTGQLGAVACQRRQGDLNGATQQLRQLLQLPHLTVRQRTDVQRRLGDRLLQAGDLSAAAAELSQAREMAADEHLRRNLDVKLLAARGVGTREIVDLLLGEPLLGVDTMVASAGLGRWSHREPSRGVADYLLAKNLMARERWQVAEEHLGRALRRSLEPPSVLREALRMGIALACALGDTQQVVARYERYASLSAVKQARREGAERFVDRCLRLPP